MNIFAWLKQNMFTVAKSEAQQRDSSPRPVPSRRTVDPALAWGTLQKRALQEAAAGNWGLYTNTQLEMVNLLNKQGRTELELEHLLWVLYLDINGPENRGGISGALLKEFPPFDKKTALIPPGLVAQVDDLLSDLELGIDECRELFNRSAARRRNNLMKVSPEAAWRLLAPHLQSGTKKPVRRRSNATKQQR